MSDLTLDDIIALRPRNIVLVISEKIGQEWHYRRMLGRKLTNHVITDAPLREGEVNQFLKKPSAFIAVFTALMGN